MIDKVREIALKTIYKVDVDNAYSNIVLNDMIKQNRDKLNLDERDIGLISEIVYGVITWKLTLDVIIKKYSKIKLKKISPWILNILRMSIYQIVFLDKIPKSAAVNEGVNLAKKYGHKSSSGFVNAILRKVSKKDYEDLFEIEDDRERISKTTSMPEWIIDELEKQGMDIKQIEEICKNSNIRPKISIRVNRLKTNKKEVKLDLKQIGIKTNEGLLDDFLVLENSKSIENIKEFKKGLFTVQDEAAGLTAIILDPTKKENILDSCSSPGGKTTYIAEISEDQAKIEAWDIHESRVKLVEKNAKRLGLISINAKLNDATIYNGEYKEKFDKILLDVPCLGLGVLKRKPDIKWQRKKEDVEKISNIQYKILENCSKYLKPGGELVYSTCSILDSENRNIILKFLNNNSDFEIKNIEFDQNKNNNMKDYFNKYVTEDGFLQIYQNEKTDGFFVCKLQKIGKI